MGTMRDLLTEWAKLEPEKCKIETRPNWDWREEFEDFYIAEEAGNKGEPGHGWGWRLVLTDKEPRAYHPWESEALMRIQWTVQAAIVERKWSFRTGYDSQYGFGYEAEIEAYGHTVCRSNGANLTEVLLATYLVELKNQSYDKEGL